ncbi:UvrD-helicase domain-containing protein [Shewanella sp. D64]|uniref:UvrD-helicase domain-containing protein n=1 Tax=unclassified Shewanella TaxID=196818 RepID=UPI0022BA347A|nr:MULTISPECIES: UvrD-helicase domain-containing protein [unclassified Shewanella]MEC4724055.1 UvrD-helicase domain-containing protein [Shewanella sp. D64]MEC4736075.1 UvrD-helicase domain-containing protein [Shewanella sp. E94]WBJ97981.1 UvrD-helicase domain-containing protein [Shewanella sp. MTB7]
MKFGLLQGLFFAQTASLCEQGLTIDGKLFPYPSMDETVEVRHGWFTQTLVWGNCHFTFFRFIASKPLFTLGIHNRLVYCKAELQQAYDSLLIDITKFDSTFRQHNRYLRHSDSSVLAQDFNGCLALFKQTVHFKKLGFDVTKLNCRLAKFTKQPQLFTEKYNQWWLDKQLDKHQVLFDSLEDNPLTSLQRQACALDEDNVLVIAGAGTGKTSTMAAKAAYLVNQGLAKPGEILMLAYGNDAKIELEARVYAIPDLNAVKVRTFHGLGKEIIQFYQNSSTQVSVLATDDKQFTQFIDSQLDEIIADPKMADPIADYFGRYLYPQVNELDFQTQGQYRSYIKNNEIRALSGDLVKSFQELMICNYLYTHGITFEYEPRYAPKDGACVNEPGKDVYQPDFYIPALDAYLEHFGIDKQGNTRPDIDKIAYNLSREWKIDLHKRHETCLLQTFSWQADMGVLEKFLERLLCDRCQEIGLTDNQLFKPISPEEVFTQVKALGVYRNVSQLMSSFVSLFKSSGLSLHDLEQMMMPRGSDNKTFAYNQLRWKVFLQLFRWVYSRYESHLSSLNTLDFSDMIAQSVEMTRANDFHQKTQGRFRYKYIMVDEFQDISSERAKLVTQLRDSSPGCALFCVGDDWQAIYRFTGSDLRLTTHFSHIFGATKVVTLDKTFRFNDRIEKVASGFIQANPAQLKKNLTTHTISDNPQVYVLINSKEAGITQAFDSILDLMSSELNTASASVMVISRFKSSLKGLSIWQKSYSQLKISGFSAHASKGKQADFVIIVDVNDDKYGFPSKLDSDPILDALLPKLDSYAYTEERRLFYVALSRAKRRVFIQAEIGKESVFVKELMEFNQDIYCFHRELTPLYVDDLSCPKCVTGKLIKRTNSKSGKAFLACSLHRMKDDNSCQYTANLPARVKAITT